MRRDSLISVRWDISVLFDRILGSCIIRYALFPDPKGFRAVIVLNRDGKEKVHTTTKEDLYKILSYLNDRRLAYQVAGYFGNAETDAVNMVRAIMMLAFAMNTGVRCGFPGKKS